MKLRHKPRNLEHAEQAALFRWVRFRVQRWPELELLHAIPNGGDRHPAVAAKLKAEGVRRGVPDICLPVPRGLWHGLYIELKAGTNGASPEQRQWISALREQGFRAEVCRGWEAAARLIAEHLEQDRPDLLPPCISELGPRSAESAPQLAEAAHEQNHSFRHSKREVNHGNSRT